MCSTVGIQTSLWMGCPIRNLKVLRLHAAPLERFAGLRVLLRLQAPRHPPRTLSSLFSCVCFGFDLFPLFQLVLNTRASAKLKEYPLLLVRCWLTSFDPNLWRVETSLALAILVLLANARPVLSSINPMEEPTWENGDGGIRLGKSLERR